MREGGLRERALALGLVDADERLVRMALLELQESLPETLLPVLVSRVIRSGRDVELRALGVRALRRSRSNLALETLLELCSGGRSILGRMKLAATTAEVVSALQVLDEVWAENPRALELLHLARKSKDPRLLRALSGKDADR